MTPLSVPLSALDAPSLIPNAPNGVPKLSWTSANSLLSTVAHGSAPFITTFLLIHLSAPMMANLGGTSLASQTMASVAAVSQSIASTDRVLFQLLGREYYQTSFGERYLLLTPIALHTISSIAKRVLNTTRRRVESTNTRPPPIRPLRSILSLTGYASFFFLLPIHFLAHRIHPTDVSPPIYALGPAELDFEYVKYGIQTWRWRSWLLYGGLVGAVLLHAADGMGIIQSVGGWGKRTSAMTRRLALLGFVGMPVMSGLWWLSRERRMVFSSMPVRMEAAFSRLWIYRV